MAKTTENYTHMGLWSGRNGPRDFCGDGVLAPRFDTSDRPFFNRMLDAAEAEIAARSAKLKAWLLRVSDF